jgi:hypothetical protein
MQKFLRSLTICVAFLFSASASAGIIIPTNLKQADRQQALRIVGFGTSSKILSDPYPLGGYSGFELGLEVENLPTDEIGQLGDKLSQPQQDISFPKLTLGKGLFDNFDFYLQFTPYNRQDELSLYGGLLRWGFYQGSLFPVNASILVHYDAGNFSNVMTTQCYGAELISGINVDNVAFYAGLGYLQATGTFVGGANGVTSTGQLESESVSGPYSTIGANVRYKTAFFSVELDRYTVAVFSGKIGLRF